MGHYKDGKPDRLQISWHKNGHKWSEETRKDGRMVSAKYWNRKGEEVRTLDEARNLPHPAPISVDWVRE